MKKTVQWAQDLELAQCMYPELEIYHREDNVVNGKLEICMVPTTTIRVELNTSYFEMYEFPGTELDFTVRTDLYPSYSDSIKWSLKSTWMNPDDVLKIRNMVEEEFKETKTERDFPLLSMIIDFLSHSILDSLAVKGTYFCDEIQWDNLRSLKEYSKIKEFRNKNFDCSICLESKKGSQGSILPCNNHYLCNDCLKQYYGTMIKEGRIENMRCPECEFKIFDSGKYGSYHDMKKALFTPVLPFTFFKDRLSEQEVNRYKTLFFEQAFVKLLNFSPYSCVICPRCDRWCAKDSLDENMIHCETCDMYFCFHCLHSWHGKHNPCGKKAPIDEELIEKYVNEETSAEQKRELEIKFGKKTMQLEADAYLAQKMLEMALQDERSNMKKCPGCRTIIEKSEGCNKMTCSICSMMFCFLCGDILDSEAPYSHFNKPFSPCLGRLFEGMPGLENLP